MESGVTSARRLEVTSDRRSESKGESGKARTGSSEVVKEREEYREIDGAVAGSGAIVGYERRAGELASLARP